MLLCSCYSPTSKQCRLPAGHVGVHSCGLEMWWGTVMFPSPHQRGWCSRHGYRDCPSACEDRRSD